MVFFLYIRSQTRLMYYIHSLFRRWVLSVLALSLSLLTFNSFPSQLAFTDGQSEGPKAGLESKELVFLVQITCQVLLYFVKQTSVDDIISQMYWFYLS